VVIVDDLSYGRREANHDGSEGRIGSIGEVSFLRSVPQDQNSSLATRNEESGDGENGDGKRGDESTPISDESNDGGYGEEFEDDKYDDQDTFSERSDFISLPLDEKESEDQQRKYDEINVAPFQSQT
jgi:hypothetical protein